MLISIDGLLSATEVHHFRMLLDGAQWQDGRRTAGSLAGAVKANLQLDDDSEIARTLGAQVLRALESKADFISAALPQRIHPPKFNCYRNGGHYGTHVDSALMGMPGAGLSLRSDLSATLFLSDPDEYDGGELEIDGAFGVQSVKLAAGDLVLYPSSSLHRVTPVTRGARLASFFWIQSLVRDEGARTLLYDFDHSIRSLRSTLPAEHPQLLKLSGLYHNLLRRWATP